MEVKDLLLKSSELTDIISSGSILKIALRVLSNINKELVYHNERTSYIALKIAQNYKMNQKCNIQNLVILSLLHTIGFFREDVITDYDPHSPDIVYFSGDKAVHSRYVFGCYYLEFMTPLHKDALALEDFDEPFNPDLKKYVYQEDYRSIITLSAYIAEYIKNNPDTPLPADLNELAPSKFDPEVVQAFHKMNEGCFIENSISSQEFKTELDEFIDGIKLPLEDNLKFFKLLVYLLDFKSTVTLTHSINTSCYALSLALRCGIGEDDLKRLFTSAVLHDIGKIATPQRILEFPGRLTPEEMGIMRYHVNHSRRILLGLVPDDILENIFRHHEKLDGSGYPNKISGDKITTLQRILTIADITSALNDSRSYKEKFTKEKTLSIIQEMADKGEIDSEIVKTLSSDFDFIMEDLKELQQILRVDYSNVIAKFNEYILNSTEFIEDFIEDKNPQVEELVELEEL